MRKWKVMMNKKSKNKEHKNMWKNKTNIKM